MHHIKKVSCFNNRSLGQLVINIRTHMSGPVFALGHFRRALPRLASSEALKIDRAANTDMNFESSYLLHTHLNYTITYFDQNLSLGVRKWKIVNTVSNLCGSLVDIEPDILVSSRPWPRQLRPQSCWALPTSWLGTETFSETVGRCSCRGSRHSTLPMAKCT